VLTEEQAIARAVYARKPVAIFDDVFSGLDKVTEKTVFNRVFAQDGLLRRSGTSIILATHAGKVTPAQVQLGFSAHKNSSSSSRF